MSLSNFQQTRIPQNLDEWSPQDDDFKSAFNSYDRGPGKYLPKRDPSSSQKHVQLYVQGIPNELTEDGLRNLFMKAGTVTKVAKMRSKKPGALDTYGFITMSNVREADEAIRRFNFFKINQFMLKVRIAVSPEERQQQQLKKQEEEEFFNSLKTFRGKAWSPANGTNTGEDCSKENWGSYQQSNGYGFSSAKSPQSSPKYGIGRGGFLKGYQDSAKVGPSGDGQKLQGAGSMNSLHNTHVPRDSFQVSEKSTKTVKLEPRECTFCKKIGTFQCKRCKIPYCCTDCQKQDWPQHKNYCSKIKEMQNTDEFKDFDVTFGEDIVDNVKNLIEKHTGDAVVVDKSPLEKTCSVQQQQNRKSGKQTGKTSMGDQSGKVRESSDAQDIQPRSKVADYNRKDISRGSDKGHVTVGNQIGQTSQNRSPHKNKMAKTRSEDYNRGKEKNDQPGNQNRRGGAERKNDFQKYQSRNKQKDGRTVASEQDWEDVTTEEQFVSSASQDIIPGTTMERQVVLAKDFPRAEPFGSEFGIVITSVVDPRCFYCQLADEEVVSAFGEMMDRLSEHCQSEPALPDVVYTEGELCSAKFQADGKWYRACIKQLNPNGTALVYYVDFGNEEVISLNDLNSLTEEFQTLPILALRCSLSGIHPIDGAWKPEAVNVLKSLQEQVLRVKLVEVFDNTYYLIVLHTRDGGETVSLNQILIEAGLAEATPVRKPSPAHAESEGLDGGEKGLVNTGRSTPDEDVKEKEELLLQEIEALKAKYEALKMKGSS